MAIAQTNRYLYLRTEFKFGFWTGDVAPTVYYGPIDFTKLAISAMKQEQDRLLSNMESSFGEVMASVAKPTEPGTLSAEFQSASSNLLALLLGADVTELNQSTAAVADEAITPVVGVWIPLANQYLAAHDTGTEIVAETSGDVVVASTHYAIDLVNGLYKALDATGATAAKLSYHKATRTGEIYAAGKAKSAYVHLVGTGTEKVTQKRCRINIWKASLSASGEFDLGAGGFLKGALAGDLITPSTKTSPWQWEYLDLASTL